MPSVVLLASFWFGLSSLACLSFYILRLIDRNTLPMSNSDSADTVSHFDPCVFKTEELRIKATATSGYTGNSAPTKKCRKKKTFAELKEEETSLLNERTYLKKEIAHANANFEAQRAKNESLKKMKLDHGSKFHDEPISTSGEQKCKPSGQPHKRMLSSPNGAVSEATQDETHSQLASESRPTVESSFVIPDLNMMPDES